MPIRKDVKEVIDLCRSLGLDPVMESGSGHYKVRDPRSGVYVFGISSSPSDPNFRWMILRHLRRLGLLKEGRPKKGRKYKRKPVIDLGALKKAQDAAASRGENIPTLDDLEDSTEFFARIKRAAGKPGDYTEEAMEEAIELMATKNAPRINASRQRFRKMMENGLREKLRKGAKARQPNTPPGKGEYTELARIAREEVAPVRGLKSWSTQGAAVQAFRSFDQTDMNPRMWAFELMEATLDHLDGLQWGVDESVKKTITPPPTSQFQPISPFLEDNLEAAAAEEEEKEEIPYSPLEAFEDMKKREKITTEDLIRDHYADALLEILKAEGSSTDEKILARLDKLAGIA